MLASSVCEEGSVRPTDIHVVLSKTLGETKIKSIDVKKRFFQFFLLFKKPVFYVFYFLERFLFSNGEILYPTKLAKIRLNLLNSCVKGLLSDGFNMPAKTNSLMNSRSPETLSCILRQ